MFAVFLFTAVCCKIHRSCSRPVHIIHNNRMRTKVVRMRFWYHDHTLGPMTAPPEIHNPAAPLTPDLRWQATLTEKIVNICFYLFFQ
jgi:hypothetical protein